jgi:lysophospholipid acyltransferase (LPLAT)-like uncharacterized protein
MKLRQPWLIRLIAFLGAWVIRVWMGTVRNCFSFADRVHPTDIRKERFIYAFWHETLLVPAAIRVKIHMLISQHADGELIARMCRHLGHDVVRGSSTRGGGTALLELVRCSKHSHLGVTPDGPRGPRRQAKMGAIYMASLTGLPIIPVGIGFTNAWRLKSWDRFAIPKPWTASLVVTGRAIHVPAKVAREHLESYRLLLEEEMVKVTAAAEKWAATGRRPRLETFAEPSRQQKASA